MPGNVSKALAAAVPTAAIVDEYGFHLEGDPFRGPPPGRVGILLQESRVDAGLREVLANVAEDDATTPAIKGSCVWFLEQGRSRAQTTPPTELQPR